MVVLAVSPEASVSLSGAYASGPGAPPSEDVRVVYLHAAALMSQMVLSASLAASAFPFGEYATAATGPLSGSGTDTDLRVVVSHRYIVPLLWLLGSGLAAASEFPPGLKEIAEGTYKEFAREVTYVAFGDPEVAAVAGRVAAVGLSESEHLAAD